ncbi:MAG: HAD-IIIA family hydrolase [Patescibacteria group bacterium]|nr:HAD-IIIA family hydrolase [Patescibacteria group bacterium]
MERRALFLDRDGTMNRMIYYRDSGCYEQPRCPDDVHLVRGIVRVIALANMWGIPVIEITNQPGIAKGRMSRQTLDAIENKLHDLLQVNGVKLNQVYRCLHHPLGIDPEWKLDCDCRKPKPGLLLTAARDFGADLTKSLFLGDKATDVVAGKSAGCKTAILLHNEDLPDKVEEAKASTADYKITSLDEMEPILKEVFLFV